MTEMTMVRKKVLVWISLHITWSNWHAQAKMYDHLSKEYCICRTCLEKLDITNQMLSSTKEKEAHQIKSFITIDTQKKYFLQTPRNYIYLDEPEHWINELYWSKFSSLFYAYYDQNLILREKKPNTKLWQFQNKKLA